MVHCVLSDFTNVCTCHTHIHYKCTRVKTNKAYSCCHMVMCLPTQVVSLWTNWILQVSVELVLLGMGQEGCPCLMDDGVSTRSPTWTWTIKWDMQSLAFATPAIARSLLVQWSIVSKVPTAELGIKPATGSARRHSNHKGTSALHLCVYTCTHYTYTCVHAHAHTLHTHLNCLSSDDMSKSTI